MRVEDAAQDLQQRRARAPCARGCPPARRPMMSLWPPRALVRLCITMSAPRPSGRCRNGRGEGVVHHHRHARGVGLARRSPRCPGPRPPGWSGSRGRRSRLRGPATSPQAQQVGGGDDPAAHAPGGQDVADELRGAAVERGAGQHLVARLQHGEDARGGGGHPGGEDDARLRAFQRGQGLLQRAQGGVAVARVELEGEVAGRLRAYRRISAAESKTKVEDCTMGVVSGPCRGPPLPWTARVPMPRRGWSALALRAHSSTACGRASAAAGRGVSGTAPTTGSTNSR